MNTTTAMPSIPQSTLFVAIELSLDTWKLAVGDGKRVLIVDVAGGDNEGLLRTLRLAKTKLGLPDTAQVIACYEAGREGFSVARVLEQAGVRCLVVDPASIEVERRARKAKTDRIDARKLLALLLRKMAYGETRALRVVNPPSPEQEDRRQISREREKLVKERTSKWNELKGLLFAQGIRLNGRVVDGQAISVDELDRMTTSDGRSLPLCLKGRLTRIIETLAHVNKQLTEVLAERAKELRAAKRAKDASAALKLMWIQGLGQTTADVFGREFFDWRNFNNGREVGSCAGLAPTPWMSGNTRHSQGISKAGNARVRSMAIELALRWPHHQPTSELTSWFKRKFTEKGERMMRVGIVALARKILVALWRFLKDGTLPAGTKLRERIAIESR